MTIYVCVIGNNEMSIEVDSDKESLGRTHYPISGYKSGNYTIRDVAIQGLLKSGLKTTFQKDKLIKRVDVFKGDRLKGSFKLPCPEEYPSDEVFDLHVNQELSGLPDFAQDFVRKWILSGILEVHGTHSSASLRTLRESIGDLKQLVKSCRQK